MQLSFIYLKSLDTPNINVFVVVYSDIFSFSSRFVNSNRGSQVSRFLYLDYHPAILPQFGRAIAQEVNSAVRSSRTTSIVTCSSSTGLPPSRPTGTSLVENGVL